LLSLPWAVPALADEARTVPPFSGVAVGAGVQARVDEGAPGPIQLGGPAEVLAHLESEVRDGQLLIQFEEGYRPPSRVKLTLAVRMPRADRLSVSGGARMDASVPVGEELSLASSGGGVLNLKNRIAPRELKMAASGGSTIQVPGAESDTLSLALSGAATITLAGRAEETSLAMSGGSILDAAGLEVSRLTVQSSGGSRGAVRARAVSAASLSGGAEIRVPASAQLGAVASSGGARLRRDL
jgi:hypothetical protein